MSIVLGILMSSIGLAAAGIVTFMVGAHASRSMAAPGLVAGRLAPCPSAPRCAGSEGALPGREVAPFPLDAYTARAREALLGAMRAEPRLEVIEDSPEYIHAQVATPAFGFIDDVEARFDAAAAVIHVRSSARVGYWDGGVNQRRLERIRTRYLAALGR